MKAELYDMIFKRKSFHLFRGVGSEHLTPDELFGIETTFKSCERLYPDIRTAVRIIPADRVNFKRDAEYCVLIYSEKKPNYLMNAGYIGQQLDLYLAAHDIGSLWYGIGKPDEKEYDGLSYVIMLAVRKVADPSLFRKDMFKARRKPLGEIWSGDTPDFADVARFAPSACNSQPWRVENKGGMLTVSRYRKNGRIGLLSPASALYFNRIDIGIYLCVLEICIEHAGTAYQRTLFEDSGDAELTKAAEYRIIS